MKIEKNLFIKNKMASNSSCQSPQQDAEPQEHQEQHEEQQDQPIKLVNEQLGNEKRETVHQAKKRVMRESIKKLNELTESLNEVCKCANQFALSLQSLEDIAMPEVIGNKMYLKVPKKKIFDNTGHLMETLTTFTE